MIISINDKAITSTKQLAEMLAKPLPHYSIIYERDGARQTIQADRN